MIEETQQDLPQPVQPLGVLNVDNLKLPKGSVALTQEGKSFTKVATQLIEFQQKRKRLLIEYQELYNTKINPLLEDIARCHAQIDAIIKEMSKS